MSAGSLGTPHILLNSGIGDSRALSRIGIEPLVDLPDVGANLCDHPAIANPFLALSNNTFENIREPNATTQLLQQWNKTKAGPLTDTVASLISFHRVTGDDLPSPDPAAGLNTPHFEHLYAVRSIQIRFSAKTNHVDFPRMALSFPTTLSYLANTSLASQRPSSLLLPAVLSLSTRLTPSILLLLILRS